MKYGEINPKRQILIAFVDNKPNISASKTAESGAGHLIHGMKISRKREGGERKAKCACTLFGLVLVEGGGQRACVGRTETQRVCLHGGHK